MAVYVTTDVAGTGYYSRRERQGKSETTVPGGRSRPPDEGTASGGKASLWQVGSPT